MSESSTTSASAANCFFLSIFGFSVKQLSIISISSHFTIRGHERSEIFSETSLVEYQMFCPGRHVRGKYRAKLTQVHRV